MTDRELLELAAKAAGFVSYDHENSLATDMWSKGYRWNPLTDDGDALRLAVKLGIGFWVGSFIVYCSWYTEGETWYTEGETWYTEGENPFTEGMAQLAEKIVNDDPYAATRRAIVRAAAEIGKAHSAASIGRNMP
jgi:hypothetical protein